MQPAADRLRTALAKTPVKPPRCPVMSNVTAAPHAAEAASGGTIEAAIRDRLVAQLTHPVRWAEDCTYLAGHIKGEFHELAPGKTLAGLMRRIDKTIKVETHDEPVV
jgi:[acyl-carrier-protein] S-malonyltransferase